MRSDKGNGWESQGFADYLGLGWYRQQFSPPAGPLPKHAYLYFGAVDEDAWLYLNGQPQLGWGSWGLALGLLVWRGR